MTDNTVELFEGPDIITTGERLDSNGDRIPFSTITTASMVARGWQPPVADDPDGPDDPEEPGNGLVLPALTGTEIFLHDNWQQADMTLSQGSGDLGIPGGVDAGDTFAIDKFRLGTNPDGTFKIVADIEAGENALEIEHSRFFPVRSRHTEIEIMVGAARWFNQQDVRYLIEFWRKDINLVPDDHWEVHWQNHGFANDSAESNRNPPMAIDGGDNGQFKLTMRADSNLITTKTGGTWDYERDESFDILANNIPDEWALWQIEMQWNPVGTNSFLNIKRKGATLHAEADLPMCYNDPAGHIMTFGMYKYFTATTVDTRVVRFGPIRVQTIP